MKFELVAALAAIGLASARAIEIEDATFDTVIESRQAQTCAYFYKKTQAVQCPRDDGDVVTNNGKRYRIACDYNINEADLSRGNVNSTKSCLTLCSKTGGCVGVTQYRALGSGDNCFLKYNTDQLNRSGGQEDSFIIVTPNSS